MRKLSLRIFLVVCTLLVACVALTWWGVLTYAPYVYAHAAPEVQEPLDALNVFLMHLNEETAPEEIEAAIRESADIVRSMTGNEYVLRVFDAKGTERAVPGLQPAGSSLADYDGLEKTTVGDWPPPDAPYAFVALAAQNTALESQVSAALRKSLPVLSGMVLASAAGMAAAGALWLSRPIRRISAASEHMAALDFGVRLPERRRDEIGALARNLNHMSESLETALSDLQKANAQLRRDAAEKLQTDKQRTDFFAAASHELKTPVTVIRGQLEGMLLNVGRYRDRDTYLARSLREVERLQDMVQDLLLLVRIDRADGIMRSEQFPLASLVLEQIGRLEDLWRSRDLCVSVVLEDVAVTGDRSLLDKALGNLFLNAATYTPRGGRIEVRLLQTAVGARLCIANSCPPLPAESLSRLFDPLYRPDASRSRDAGGSGLGLYIVQTIAELHDAAVAARSTPDGLEIILQFPGQPGDGKQADPSGG